MHFFPSKKWGGVCVSYGAKVVISPPLAPRGEPPKDLSEPSRTLAGLPPRGQQGWNRQLPGPFLSLSSLTKGPGSYQFRPCWPRGGWGELRMGPGRLTRTLGRLPPRGQWGRNRHLRSIRCRDSLPTFLGGGEVCLMEQKYSINRESQLCWGVHTLSSKQILVGQNISPTANMPMQPDKILLF